MATWRKLASAALSKGVLTPGWYAIATGVAMLAVVWLLASASDPSTVLVVVALVLAVAGIYNIERGVRAEYQRRPRD